MIAKYLIVYDYVCVLIVRVVKFLQYTLVKQM